MPQTGRPDGAWHSLVHCAFRNKQDSPTGFDFRFALNNLIQTGCPDGALPCVPHCAFLYKQDTPTGFDFRFALNYLLQTGCPDGALPYVPLYAILYKQVTPTGFDFRFQLNNLPQTLLCCLSSRTKQTSHPIVLVRVLTHQPCLLSWCVSPRTKIPLV
jgi:hypothetical protein